jgi:hypothetical protein
MASTNEDKREKLKEVFEQTIKGNENAIQDLIDDLIEIEPIIEYWTPSCEGFDTKIVSLISNINTLKSEIVSIHATASANPHFCGDTVGISTMFKDVVYNLSFNVNQEDYITADHYDYDPNGEETAFNVITTELVTQNVGYGTLSKYVPNDPTAGIGSTFRNIGSGGGSCANFAKEIAEKEKKIEALRVELIPLLEPVNFLKQERLPYHVRRYRDKVEIVSLNAQNVRLDKGLEALNNSTFDPYTAK